MQHLFRSWPSIAAAIQAAPYILFLSDYDGTLTPIVGHPRDALLPPDVKKKLLNLMQKEAVSVGVISGRSIAYLRALVGIEGIYYAGNHGLEIEGPGLSFISEPAETGRAVIKEIAGKLAAALDGISGIYIEDKGLSLSLHYRQVKKEQEDSVISIFRETMAPFIEQGKVTTFTGKKVLEVRPPIDWNKGNAVTTIRREIMSLRGLERGFTFYLGDDTTDEDAFRVLQWPEGLSVYVGGENPASAAEYYLDATEEVAELLDRLIELR